MILSPRPDNKFSIEFGSRLLSPSQNRSPSQKLPGKKLIPLGLAIITFILPREKSERKTDSSSQIVQAKSVGCEMILVMCFYPIWNLFKRLPSPGWTYLRIMQVNSTGFFDTCCSIGEVWQKSSWPSSSKTTQTYDRHLVQKTPLRSEFSHLPFKKTPSISENSRKSWPNKNLTWPHIAPQQSQQLVVIEKLPNGFSTFGPLTNFSTPCWGPQT